MKVPENILTKFEQAATGLEYGESTLTYRVKMGKPLFIINREESFLPSTDNQSVNADFPVIEVNKKHGLSNMN